MSKASLLALGDKLSPKTSFSSLPDTSSRTFSGFSSPEFPILLSSCKVAPDACGLHSFIKGMILLLSYNFEN